MKNPSPPRDCKAEAARVLNRVRVAREGDPIGSHLKMSSALEVNPAMVALQKVRKPLLSLREGCEPATPPSQETGEVCSLCVLPKCRTTFKLPRVREWRTK